MEDTTVVESVTGAIESMEESQAEALQSIRIYGPVTKMEDGRLSIDNQSGMSSSGEIILNVSSDATYILDAVTGLSLIHIFHFTGITPAVSDAAIALTEAALKAAKAHGVTVSVDLNFRKKLWSSEKAQKVMTCLLYTSRR